MARAFLVVMDSVGIGGAPDAGQFHNGRVPDTGANTVAHIAQACAAGRAELAAAVRSSFRIWIRSGWARLSRLPLARRPRVSGGTPGSLGRGHRRLAGQGYALGALGTRGPGGPLGMARLSRHRARLSVRTHRGRLCRRRDGRHPGKLPRLGHRDHRGTGHAAPAHRLADLLTGPRTVSFRWPPTKRRSGWTGFLISAGRSRRACMRCVWGVSSRAHLPAALRRASRERAPP